MSGSKSVLCKTCGEIKPVARTISYWEGIKEHQCVDCTNLSQDFEKIIGEIVNLRREVDDLKYRLNTIGR